MPRSTAPSPITLRGLIERRLHAQMLTGAPAPSAADYVARSLCVHANAMPLTRVSIGLRTRSTEAAVLRDLTTLPLLRLRLMRGEWWMVHRDDARWLLDLLAPALLETALDTAAVQRLGEPELTIAAEAARALLRGGRALPPLHLMAALPPLGEGPRPQLDRHLVTLLHLSGVVCSTASPTGGWRLRLLDDVVPPAARLRRSDAVRRLVRRFLDGHGPSTTDDIVRWSGLPLAEIASALAELEPRRGSYTERQLWWMDGCEEAGLPRPLLMPPLDEAMAPHQYPRMPRLDRYQHEGRAGRRLPFGGGYVIVAGRDVGSVSVTQRSGGRSVLVCLAPGADDAMTAAVRDGVRELEHFWGQRAELDLRQG